ncbi:MAG: glycosyltransferase [Terriglobales bacterium]
MRHKPFPDPLPGYTAATARLLGGAVLVLGDPPPAGDPTWEGIEVLRQQPAESAAAAWRRALDQVQPKVVFVQHLGGASPALLSLLRERGIASAVFLHDFTPVCPTDRLWHASQEPCSGPGRWGWKCALCASAQASRGGMAGVLRRIPELPLRILTYRHRPQLWRTAMMRADALIASSRFEREFWIGHGAPPERIAVVPPLVGAGAEPLDYARPRTRRLFYAGGWDEANGASLLAGGLDLLRQPVTVVAMGEYSAAARAALRASVAGRHQVEFPGAMYTAVLPALLANSDAAVVPARWSVSFSAVIRHAQLAGMPVVAAAVGGLSEQIIHGVNGYLAAASDFDSLAEALTEAFAPQEAGFDAAATARNARQMEGDSAALLSRLLTALADNVGAGPNAGSAKTLAPQSPHPIYAGGPSPTGARTAARPDGPRPGVPLAGAAQPEAALALEHGAWLDEISSTYGVSPGDAARQLAAALRLVHDASLGEAEPNTPLALACVQRAASTLRQQTLDLNHAIAFFRACGCHRIARLPPGPGPNQDPDSARQLAAWNLETVPETELPDGLWEELEATAPAPLLRRRHPQARALVRQTPGGLETLDWRED